MRLLTAWLLTLIGLLLGILGISSSLIGTPKHSVIFPIGAFMASLVGLCMLGKAVDSSQPDRTKVKSTLSLPFFRIDAAFAKKAVNLILLICFLTIASSLFYGLSKGGVADGQTPVYAERKSYFLRSHGKHTTVSRNTYLVKGTLQTIAFYSVPISMCAMGTYLFAFRAWPIEFEN